MAKRKAERARNDPATDYRAKLAARQAKLEQARLARWSPRLGDRATITFARLLHVATAPSTKVSSLRKGFLERRVFNVPSYRPADRKALYRASQAVVRAARAKDTLLFEKSKVELDKQWQTAKATRRANSGFRPSAKR